MKRLLTIQLTIIILLATSTCFASDQQSQDSALQSFQPILAAVTAFFTKNPKLLVKISPPANPALTAYFTTHFIAKNSNYDIVTTNSIVTPYRGFIDIDTEVFDNKPCGTVSFDGKTPDGWATVDEAIQFNNDQKCYVSRTAESGTIRHRFVFVYQALEKKWILSELLYQDGQPNGRFLVLLGIPSAWFPVFNEPRAREFNAGWYELFKRL